MGAVYSAEHVGIGKKVAVKFLRADLRGQPALAQRLRREAMAVSKLKDIHTITVFDFGVWQGLAYLVMELLEGQDLAGLLKAELRIDVPRALMIARQICASLSEAHELGVVHRDLKPENVFIVTSRSGEELVKVLDFGLAKLLDIDAADGRFNTADGAILGTPCYMAPEQVTGQDVGTKADLYALGALMYRMVTGYLPFTGRSPLEVFSAQRHGDPKPFQAVCPDLVAPDYEALVFELLSKTPEQRPESAHAVAESLKHLQSQASSRPAGAAVNVLPHASDVSSWDVDITQSAPLDGPADHGPYSEKDVEWFSMTREDFEADAWGFQDDGKEWELDGSFASHLFFQDDSDESYVFSADDEHHSDPLVTRLRWARRLKISLAVLLVCSSSFLGWWAYQNHYRPGVESEPNDSALHANQLYPGHAVTGFIGKRNISEDRSDADHYKMAITGTTYLEVTVSKVPRMDLVIDVAYPEPAKGSDDRPRLSSPTTLNSGGVGDGEHHIVGPFSAESVYFTVREKWDPSVQPTENSTDAYTLTVWPVDAPDNSHPEPKGAASDGTSKSMNLKSKTHSKRP